MKQLELFEFAHLPNSSDASSSSLTHWEHENQNSKLNNRSQNAPPRAPEEDEEVFDNPNNITELAVSEYQPGGTASKNNKYYRFSYKDKGKVIHTHIKGGNTCNKIAIERKEQVERWILLHTPPQEIVKRIKQW
ncbi:MAG: hypothetical protein QNJ64_08420 [Crocosphaera sp.]|nr:hypothetical protein [Crocosphaera sp.]